MNLLKKFVRDEAGMETVEWTVMAAMIVTGLIAIIDSLGTNVLDRFTSLKTATDAPVAN